MGPSGAALARPRRGRPARADRRHVGRRQERAAAVDGRVAGPRVPADPAELPVRRLQGRRRRRRCSTTCPTRSATSPTSTPGPVAAGAHVAAGRAQPAHAADGGQGQGPRGDAREVPRRGTGVAGDRGRRVRHPGEGDPRVRRRRRRHRPAGPQPRHPPRARHPAAVGLGERQHPRQHQPAHLAAHARRPSRGRDRRPGGGRHPGAAQGPRLRQARSARPDRVPVRVHRAPRSPRRPRSAR